MVGQPGRPRPAAPPEHRRRDRLPALGPGRPEISAAGDPRPTPGRRSRAPARWRRTDCLPTPRESAGSSAAETPARAAPETNACTAPILNGRNVIRLIASGVGSCSQDVTVVGIVAGSSQHAHWAVESPDRECQHLRAGGIEPLQIVDRHQHRRLFARVLPGRTGSPPKPHADRLWCPLALARDQYSIHRQTAAATAHSTARRVDPCQADQPAQHKPAPIPPPQRAPTTRGTHAHAPTPRPPATRSSFQCRLPRR